MTQTEFVIFAYFPRSLCSCFSSSAPDIDQVKNWRDAKIRPVSLYATFGE